MAGCTGEASENANAVTISDDDHEEVEKRVKGAAEQESSEGDEGTSRDSRKENIKDERPQE